MKDTKKKLIELEAVYGTQAKAAKKLGVSVAQYRKYKTGKVPIPDAKASRASNLHRANAKTRRSPEFEKKLEKKKATTEVKRQKRYPGGVKTESLMSWMRRKNLPHHIQVNLPDKIRSRRKDGTTELWSETIYPFVAYPAYGSDDTVQFVSVEDIANLRYGKQASTRSLYLVGLVVNLVTTNGKGGFIIHDDIDVNEVDPEDMEVFKTRAAILTKTREAWSITETLNFASHLFMSADAYGGKLEPARFLGFQL